MILCYNLLALWALAVIPLIWIARWYLPLSPRLISPRVALFSSSTVSRFTPRTVWNLLRATTLAAIIAACAGCAWVGDPAIERDSGVAIMLVLDMSGSMDLFDDPNDQTSRFARVKSEAQQFIVRRPHDLMGVVLCGATALSRCPLTFDKTLLCTLIDRLSLGDINPDGTALSTAIGLASRRLASADAHSKIMIVITDGTPTPGDLDPALIIPYVKEQGITIYTIGVGSEQGGYAHHPMMGIVRVPTPLNSELLRRYAHETGGEFYRVDERHDLRSVYAAIDAREKSNFQAPTFRVYHDLTRFFVMFALLCMLLECAASWWWRRLV